MYYILNQNGQIVAVDPELLAQLAIDDVDKLYAKISLKELSIAFEDNMVTVTNNAQTHTFTAQRHPLTGILGELTLISIDAQSRTHEESTPDTLSIATDDELFSIKEDETPLVLEDPTHQIAEEEPLSLEKDEILFELKEPEAETKTEEETFLTIGTDEPQEPTVKVADEELFDLLIPSEADNAIAKIEEDPEDIAQHETTPIYIDVQMVSEKIGISVDDYNQFLDEYIDTAMKLEEALQSNQKEEQADALHKLIHLSNVLHLPKVEDILTKIEEASENKKSSHIALFFNTLGRLTTARFDDTETAASTVTETEPQTTPEPEIALQPEESVPETPVADTKEETVPVEESVAEAPAQEEQRAPIDLSDVTPIHFDFQLEEAANDLSLPVELIEEFVNDFIVQAHDETQKMIKAYEKGDLDTVQKIGHLLKGTSSNLRITPLADTLYEIQFNEDIDRVPELVRNYWGHFLSLENQIKLISQ